MVTMNEMLALLKADRDGVIDSLGEVTVGLQADFFWHFRPFDVENKEPKVETNFPGQYVRSYQDQKQQRCDPVVVASLASNVLLWWQQDTVASPDPAAQQALRERFAQGCCVGVSLPVRGKAGEFSIFSLWSSNRDGFSQAVSDGFHMLHTYALYVHEALFRNGRNNESHGLSDMELELLRWTALGKTAWEISVLVSLPERTVHYHLAEASRKLSAPNKTAAVCNALKAGLLDL